MIDKSISFCCGNVVTDKHLGLKAADDSFCHYVGDKNVGNLAKSAHPEDLELISSAVNKLTLEEPAVICYRIMTADGTYHFVVAKFHYEDARSKAFGAIKVSFADLHSMDERMADCLNYSHLLEDYLDLMGVVLFEYNKQANTVTLYTGNRLNRIVLLEGSFEDFETVCGKLPLDEVNRKAMNNILNLLKQDSGTIIDEVVFPQDADKKLPLLPDYFVGQTLRFKGKHIEDDMYPRVQGYLFTVGTGAVGSNGIMEGSMDTSLNIYNKKSITDYAKRQIERGKEGYLAILDVDNFKNANDTYGHMYGDEVLQTIAAIIKENIIGRGIVGRIGGDEFMIVFDRRCSHGDLRGILRGIRSTIQYTYESSENPSHITASIGICNFGTLTKTYEDCFKVADMMLYRAKDKGRNRYIIYEPEIHGNVLDPSAENKETRFASTVRNKDQFMMSLFNLFSTKKTMPYSVALSTAAKIFSLDEIIVAQNNLPIFIYPQVADNELASHIFSFAGTESFNFYYKDTGMAVVNHAIDTKEASPECYEYMTSKKYESLLCYRGNTPGTYVLFVRSAKRGRKWEDADVSYLTFIGQLFDLELENR